MHFLNMTGKQMAQSVNNVRLLIFDLDGTLLNTLGDLCFCGNHILEKHGFPTHPLDAYRYFVGNGIMKLVERMLPENAREPSYMNRIYAEYMSFYQQHKMDTTAPYEGIVPLVDELSARGILSAVASNKAHEAMDELMQHYFPHTAFSVILGKRPNVPPKPAPDIVFDILSQTQVQASEALYLGDTAVDMETARRAGVKKIGALWGFRTQEELLAAGADFLAASPAEVLDIVRKCC